MDDADWAAAHDFGFTMEFHANFTYFKGAKQAFTFRGGDDVWVFFNGKRVIDLGGIHLSQDRLVYPLDFFFAERHTTTSKLRITTSLELEPLLSKPFVTPGRFFEGQVSITATHPSAAAVLYYTTDGSTPDAKSQKYTGPITLSATTVLKVIAIRPGYRNSEVVAQTFTKMQTVATPGAVIHLDIPASISLIDPFTNAPAVLPSGYITKGNGGGPGILSRCSRLCLRAFRGFGFGGSRAHPGDFA